MFSLLSGLWQDERSGVRFTCHPHGGHSFCVVDGIDSRRSPNDEGPSLGWGRALSD